MLGHSEACTGDPARRTGNEMLFQMLAEQNVETLKAANAKKVVTSCPHCLHTLRHDYPQFGGNFEVVHHTQLIDHLYKTGKLRTETAVADRQGHLSRQLLPRPLEPRVRRAARRHRGGRRAERRRDRRATSATASAAAPAAAACSWRSTRAQRVNLNRTDEVIATGVEAVAVACPFCNIMLTDGMKQRNMEDKIQVLDVAELVAQSIPDVPVGNLVRKKRVPDA